MATFQLIRSATLKVRMNGLTFLIDPMLGEKGSFESYGNLANNPISDLPLNVDDILTAVDAVLVSHLHKDHFDDAARELLQKDIPIFCQPGDQARIAESGFTNVTEIETNIEFKGVTITRTGGNHGRGEIEKHMGKVSGFVLKVEGEPSIYIVGDSIFNQKVKQAIDTHKPDYIVTNSGGAFIPGFESDLILMDESETIDVANYAKNSKIIAIHLEALDHCTVNRASIQRAALASGLADRVHIPLDGEELALVK
ncbi:MAG: MBL fold metallo-hydrolase [Flavobacteriaceae bacterium]|nr:MBL fold metallo-hydrolase [Flavobacteriaceae bacterium]|tara:strand:+ start:103610 stop:104371 length:762 start_codon:yes stop_codon:yes gene_type:complete